MGPANIITCVVDAKHSQFHNLVRVQEMQVISLVGGKHVLVTIEVQVMLLRLGLVTSRSSYTGSVFKVISGRIRIESVVQVVFDV